MNVRSVPPPDVNSFGRGGAKTDVKADHIAGALLLSDPPSRWRFVVPPALVLLVFLAFMPALTAGLVYWDDDDLLIHNTRHEVLDLESLKWMFTTSYSGHFQPLTWLTYAFDVAAWGGHPAGYHLTSVMLHAVTAIAFYYLARMLLAAGGGKIGPRNSGPLVLSAGFAAALFAVHPLRAESVAWLAERRDVLSGALYVAAVGFYLRYVHHAREGDGSVVGDAHPATSGVGLTRAARVWYVAAAGACALSLMAKASAMTLPFVLLILDVYPLRRLGGKSGWLRGTVRRIWIEKLPLLALAIAGGLRALIAQARGGDLYSIAEYGPMARLAQACYGLTFYIRKTFVPTDLGPLYEIPPRAQLLGPTFGFSAAAVTGLVVVAIVLRRRLPAVPAALAVYAITLAPVLGLAQSGPQLVADRYSYLSCMGFAALGGGALLRCFRRGSWWAAPYRRAALTVLAAGLLVALEKATFRQADFWQSPYELWTRGVEVSPNSAIAHTNLADLLAWSSQDEAAAEHYRIALAIDPNDAVALHHLGDLLERTGKPDLAMNYYIGALRLDPNRPGACFSLAKLLVSKGRAKDAVAVLRDGVKRAPGSLQIAQYLSELLASHPDDSLRSAEEAVALAKRVNDAYEGKDASALVTLATALAEAGRFAEATHAAASAVEIAEAQDRTGYVCHTAEHRLELFRNERPYRLEE